jgi:hypothetical protein
VCVFTFVKSLPLKTLFAILIASGPLILTIDIAPTPKAVDIAAIVSFILFPSFIFNKRGI